MTFDDLVSTVACAPAHLPHFVVGVGDPGSFVIRVHVLQPLEPSTECELYEWLRERTPMTLGLEMTRACCKALDCGGLCRLKRLHEGACLCIGDVDGVGTCPA